MKRRLYLLLVAILLVSFGILLIGGLANNRIKENLRKDLVAEYSVQQQAVGQEVAFSLQNKIENIQNSLNALIYDEDIQSGSTESCNAALQRYHSILKLDIGNLGRVGLDGKFHCSINRALVGTPASRLGNYLDPLFQQPDHPSVVSHQLKVPNVPGYIVAVHVPVYDNQQNFIGSLGGAVYLNDLARDYLSKVKFAETGFAGLQDDNGDILYTKLDGNMNKNYWSPDIQNQLKDPAEFSQAIRQGYQGKNNVVRYTIRGVDKIASITSVEVTEGHRWIVIVNVPETEIANLFFGAGLNRAFLVVELVLILAIGAIGLLFLIVVKNYRLQQVKDDFVSLASHQLKTPATGVKQYLGMLLQGYTGKLSKEQQEAAQEAYDANERQIEIVEDLLNVARIDSGRLKLTKKLVDVTKLVDSIVSETSIQCQAKKQTLSLHNQPGTKVMGDELYLRMAIENLISNASKYTDEGGKIEVIVSKLSHSVSIAVQDNGVGIKQQDIDKLSKKFGRVNNRLSATAGGTGLGLYLVKNIIHLHQGKLEVTSEPGRGSQFVIQLPRKK